MFVLYSPSDDDFIRDIVTGEPIITEKQSPTFADAPDGTHAGCFWMQVTDDGPQDGALEIVLQPPGAAIRRLRVDGAEQINQPAEHCYAQLNPATRSLIRTTGPLAKAPDNQPPLIWQQCADDSPAFNPQFHERHSPVFEMRNDGRFYRVFQIRPRSK